MSFPKSLHLSRRIGLPAFRLFVAGALLLARAAEASGDTAAKDEQASAVDGKTLFHASTVADNGMPKDIVKNGAKWNFGAGSLWTYKGWQYATYWDDSRQVAVARRQLPEGPWAVISLPGYQRGEVVKNPAEGADKYRRFGDMHEKVVMGISPDGVIHLTFDHHTSTLHYRASKPGVADDPAGNPWTADLFGPVMNNLGGPKLDKLTYPEFTTDGTRLMLYFRTGAAGNGDSNFFEYEAGKWTINTVAASKFIDRNWSGGDKNVNAYPQGLFIRNGRRHLTWWWRDTPSETSCHDLCYAYSDDNGKTWLNNDGQQIGQTGTNFVTADSPGLTVWKIPPGSKYGDTGSMVVDSDGRVHVLVHGKDGSPIHFDRDPTTKKWNRHKSAAEGELIAGKGDDLYIATDDGLMRTSASHFGEMTTVSGGHQSLFKDSSIAVDRNRGIADGWISVIGQSGKIVTVVDYSIGK
jgi:ribosomal protein L24E